MHRLVAGSCLLHACDLAAVNFDFLTDVALFLVAGQTAILNYFPSYIDRFIAIAAHIKT
jgi:hypothetical protein